MAYSLSTHYAGQGLLDSFSFFTGEEPNRGFVDYKSREEAIASNLVSIDEFNRVKLGVDSINTYSTSDKGRPSVRITSDDSFTHGLFIADFAHMPSSTCGTWPAFWAFNNHEDGAFWPRGGEIDIIEGANTAERNLFSAHTTPGCHAPRTGFTGVQAATNCSSSPDNVGCNYAAPVSHGATYGDAFNAVGGGVYALEWNSHDIKIWHFPRTAIPNDISHAPVITPDPANWGPPQALFGGPGCKADSHFFNMSLVINTNFCGAYAGDNWGVADECNELAPTCEEYVAGNPSSFINAFWHINYIDIYQKNGLPDLIDSILNSTLNNTILPPFLNITILPPFPNSTILPLFPNSTTLPTPPFSNTTILPTPPVSNTTSLPLFSNDTARITRTRTVTVTTITQAISTAEPKQTSDGLTDPAMIDDWTLLGCFGPLSGQRSFSQVASAPTMDNRFCVASCAGRKYAGVCGETCYCADTLGDSHAVANENCSGVFTKTERKPAFAGISAATTKIHNNNMTLQDISKSNFRVDPLLPRATAPSDIFLTVYGNIKNDIPPGAPGMGGNHAQDLKEEVPQDPKGEVRGQAVTVTSAVTVTYTTICPTNAAKLVTLEYYTTLTTQQPCRLCTGTAPLTPTVPMTTCTQTCDACGPNGESTVTLTVPAAIAVQMEIGTITAVAVQTVVPILASWPSVNASHAIPSDIPVMGAGSAITVAGSFLRTFGYGLAIWFAVFWVGVIL